MNIITRQEAISQGLKWYYTGNPCKNGHICEFHVKSGCKICIRQSHDRYYQTDKGKESNRIRNLSLMEDPEFKQRFKDKVKDRSKTPEGRAIRANIRAKYRAAKLLRTVKWADQDKIKLIYANCPDGFNVDHIIPLQGKLVSGLHVEYNLQYLPALDNVRKGNKFTIED